MFCCQSHWRTPRPPTSHLFKCDVIISHSSCLAKPKTWHSTEIDSKCVGPLCALQIWKHIHWAFKYMNRLNTYWTPPECLWVRGNANEWVVSGNSPWTPIECAWTPLSHYWTRLTMVRPWERSHLCQNWTAPEHLWVHVNAFEWVLNTPWMLVSAREHLWVSIELALNACECAWMPMSEWEQPLNTHCVLMNAFE